MADGGAHFEREGSSVDIEMSLVNGCYGRRLHKGYEVGVVPLPEFTANLT